MRTQAFNHSSPYVRVITACRIAMSSPTQAPPLEVPEFFTVPSPEVRASVTAHTPILFSAQNEPYLPLPKPFSNFRLTTPRQSDVPETSALLVRPICKAHLFQPRLRTELELCLSRAIFASLAPSSGHPFRISPSMRSAGLIANAL